jgi:hypothetical protein
VPDKDSPLFARSAWPTTDRDLEDEIGSGRVKHNAAIPKTISAATARRARLLVMSWKKTRTPQGYKRKFDYQSIKISNQSINNLY